MIGPQSEWDLLSTKEKMLQVAFRLFVERGFDATPITEVERQVGLTPGTGSFYRHFPSKHALLQAAIEHHIGKLNEDFDKRWSDVELPEDPHQARVAVAKQALRDIRRFDSLLRLMIAESGRVPDVRDMIVNALGTRHALGSWIAEPRHFVGIAALLGYHVFSITSEYDLPDEETFVEALVDAVGSTLPADERGVPDVLRD